MLEKLSKKTSVNLGSILGYLFILIFPILYKVCFSTVPIKSYTIVASLFYCVIYTILFFSVLAVESLFRLNLNYKLLEKKSWRYIVLSGFIFSLVCFLYGLFCITAYTNFNLILACIILYWIVGIITILASIVGFIYKLQFNKIFIRVFLVLSIISVIAFLLVIKA